MILIHQSKIKTRLQSLKCDTYSFVILHSFLVKTKFSGQCMVACHKAKRQTFQKRFTFFKISFIFNDYAILPLMDKFLLLQSDIIMR